MNDTLVYVGTYTGARSKAKGIYLFRLQTENLEVSQNITLVPLGLAAEAVNPSFIALDLMTGTIKWKAQRVMSDTFGGLGGGMPGFGSVFMGKGST